jgi:plasmid stability protein
VTSAMENIVSIGEFASYSRLSRKALGLDGENDLLPPAWVWRCFGAGDAAGGDSSVSARSDHVQTAMCSACDNVLRMAHIQIRNVPPELHRKLKVRAAEAGMTLSDYLLREVERTASRPTIDELTRRIESRKLVRLKSRPADLIREDRDNR